MQYNTTSFNRILSTMIYCYSIGPLELVGQVRGLDSAVAVGDGEAEVLRGLANMYNM